jgi:glycosyltransferase involved in cell wall biosynthesis
MDCFVLPSYESEGVPQALLQAMAVGLPIISCPIGGIPESVKNYPDTTLVPPKNIDALAQAMSVNVQKKGNRNITRVRHTVHSLESMYKSALNVYKLVAQKIVSY